MYKYNMGGSVPRETNIAGQRHSLAYINPFEEDLLNTQYRGGEGQPVPPVPGPGGVPAYRGQGAGDPRDFENKPFGGGSTYNPDNYSGSSGKTSVSGGRGSTVEKPGARKTFNETMMATSNKDDNRGPVYATPAVTSPTIAPAPVTASAVSSNVQTATGPTAKELRDAKDARLAKGRSGLESLANSLTPNDFMVYNSAGQLVYESKHPTVLKGDAKAGDPVRADELNSFGFKVGMGNTGSNDATPGVYSQGFGSGIKSDFDMKFAAGFGSSEEQRTNLLLAGYSPEQVDTYFAETEAAMARDPYVPGSGDGGVQSNIIGELATEVVDPCPEGYKMDPVTNACVIDPDIGMGPPVFTPSDPNAAVGGSPGYTQPIGNFIPTPLQPNPVNPMQQQLNNITRSLQPQQNQQMAGGLAGIRR